jgi:hypothetical protein
MGWNSFKIFNVFFRYLIIYRMRYSTLPDSVYNKISEKYIEDFKGVPSHTEFRIIDV